MRGYVLSREPSELRIELGSNAAYVAKIVSEVRNRVEIEQSSAHGGEDDRWRLLQGVTTFLTNAANVQPLMILLEDLHWSDRGTLDLLLHLARNLQGARLLIIGTYRDAEVDRSHPLSNSLAELRRVGSFTTVRLRGLNPHDVQKMLANIANSDVPFQLAEQVHRQTEGHPLFVQEVMRYLVEEGILNRGSSQRLQSTTSTPIAMQIPEGLRDVIGKRISRLSHECNRVLSVAAVIGRDFSFDVLSSVGTMPEEAVLAAVEEATKVGVLQEQQGAGPARYRFAHAFFRQILYEEMIAPRRLRLHQEVARALEKQYARRLDEHAAELAEHFSYSTDAGDLAKAVEYAERAAVRASAVYDYGETARLLEKALGVQEVLDPEDGAKRCDLLLAYGQALLPAGEPRRAAEEVAREAFALAERLADADRVCRACQIASTGLFAYGGFALDRTPTYARWAERADEWAPAGTAHRAQADIYRARVLIAQEDWEGAWPMLQGALAMAREVGDVEALFTAAVLLVTPPHLPEFQEAKLSLVEEFTTRSRTGASATTVGRLLIAAHIVFLEWGSRSRAEGVLRQLEELAERTREPLASLQASVCRMRMRVIDGQLDEAVASSLAFQEKSAAAGSSVMGALLWSSYAFRARLLTGAAADALAGVGLYVDAAGVESSAFEISQRALALAHLGRYSEVSGEVQGLNTRDSSSLPDARRLSASVAFFLLEAAVVGGDAAAAAALVARLAPLASLATSFTNWACPSRLLGGAALLLGEPTKARAFYETGLAAVASICFRPEVALTRLEIAELLLDHYPDERDEAERHLDFAIGEFQQMKMAPSLDEAMRLRFSLQGLAGGDPNSSIVAVSRLAQAERPDLTLSSAPDGSITIMFTDIENSTALTEQLGDSKWIDLLREHNAVVEREVQMHSGKVVKNRGDGYMLIFAAPGEGLDCAAAIQQALAGHDTIRVRIGLHVGNPLREGDDFFGTDVNFAARVADRALGGQVLVSTRLHDLLKGDSARRFGEPVAVEFKGFAGAHHVYTVMEA